MSHSQDNRCDFGKNFHANTDDRCVYIQRVCSQPMMPCPHYSAYGYVRVYRGAVLLVRTCKRIQVLSNLSGHGLREWSMCDRALNVDAVSAIRNELYSKIISHSWERKGRSLQLLTPFLQFQLVKCNMKYA